MHPSLPIGIFDSGLGGLTIMREVIRLLPTENLLYFADTANLPYGEKSPEEILHLTLKSATTLAKRGIKLLVLACHTASCYALKPLELQLPFPVIGMIEPTFMELKKTHPSSIALLGTTSTIESGVYQTLLHAKFPEAKIFPLACPLFVPHIEKGLPLKSIVQCSLAPLIKENISAALLACTHYPMISPLLQEILGANVQILEPAEQCAKLVYDRLRLLNLQNKQINPPTYEFLSSGNRAEFSLLAKTFLGKKQEIVKRL